MKPGLVRLMAMTSSAMGTVSSRSSRAVYLPWQYKTAQNTSTLWIAEVKAWSRKAKMLVQVQPVQQSSVSACNAKELKGTLSWGAHG